MYIQRAELKLVQECKVTRILLNYKLYFYYYGLIVRKGYFSQTNIVMGRAGEINGEEREFLEEEREIMGEESKIMGEEGENMG